VPLPSAEGLNGAWDRLAGADGANALAAEWELFDRPAQAVALLREQLRPVRAADESGVRKLIAQLASAAFAERETATRALRELGDSAVEQMRAALKAGVPAEAKFRVERLLAEADATGFPPGARQREVRAIAVLERINTDDARKLLSELTKGLPNARLTHDAAAALKRCELSKGADDRR
jgi:hypothetical protein